MRVLAACTFMRPYSVTLQWRELDAKRRRDLQEALEVSRHPNSSTPTHFACHSPLSSKGSNARARPHARSFVHTFLDSLRFCFCASASALLLPRFCFRASASALLLLRFCFCASASALLLPRFCFCASASALLLPRFCFSASASALLLPRFCFRASASALLLPRFCFRASASALLLPACHSTFCFYQVMQLARLKRLLF
jgi:hypothetical protein